MRSWPNSEFQNLFEWEKVEGMTNLLNNTVSEMDLGRDQEWIKEVIKEAAELLPESIIEGQQSDYLAEYILGLSAARNALVVASYCIRFLKGQGYMPAEKADYVEAQRAAAQEAIDDLVSMLALDGAEALVVLGEPGHEICQAAETLPASVVVLGTHGRGGIKRAIMGSTSDHVVRHSPCPVLVQGASKD